MSIANTFLFHLLLQPISIYCNGVVTQQFQGLDEGRSSQLHEGLHDTCGFLVSSTTQVIHWHHMLARTTLKDSPGPSYRPWLVIHQHLHATCWWCSSIGEREGFMTIISNVSFVWMGLRWCNRTSWSAFGKKSAVRSGDAFRIDRPKTVQQRPIAAFCFWKNWTLAEKDGSASSSTCWFEKNMRPQLKAGGSLANLGFLGWEGKLRQVS